MSNNISDSSFSFGFPIETIQEGSASLVVPRLKMYQEGPNTYIPSRAPVFYNPTMRLSRDIAVFVLKLFQQDTEHNLTILDPFAGSGVRGIRIAKEVNSINRIEMNDINPLAFKLIKHNIQLNNLDNICSCNKEDSNLFLSKHGAPRKRVDYIDIDPFGAPVKYTDSAVRALRRDGLLAITATDLSALCGVYPKAALRKYGGIPLRTEYCHEVALRLLIASIVRTAAKNDLGVDPLFSHSTRHYIRFYSRVNYGAKKANASVQQLGFLRHCFNCFYRDFIKGTTIIQEKCVECGSDLRFSGPLWIGRIVDPDFCSGLKKLTFNKKLSIEKQVTQLISMVEAESDAPSSFYVIDKICDKFNLAVPPLMRVISKLREKGFEAFPTHFHTRGVKTNALPSKILNTIKEAL